MKKFISFILVFLFTTSFATAHRGRTDAQGGHYDKNNESGLGSYHYHHGYSAHLHENGVCPYEVTITAPAEPTEPEPQQQEPIQSEHQPLLEPVSEEDIDYSQFESLEEAYELGYFYALYHKYSNLYEESEDRSKLESLLNLGILTNLYFKNSKITYSDEVEVEDFTNEDAFEEGKVQGSNDLENTLSEYENSDFYTNNEIYKAGYDAATDEEQLTETDLNISYQDGYKKGANDTHEEYKSKYQSEQDTIIMLKSVSFVMFFVIIILGYKLLKR